MIRFVNAKVNIGLNVVERRPDGYHNIQTLFYPVGLYAGTPNNPDPFCDILEAKPKRGGEQPVTFSGRRIDCPPGKNLVEKAYAMFCDAVPQGCGLSLHLDKHLPDGAGLGGGSADASFTLMMLNEICDSPLSEEELSIMSSKLGADCPFFIMNRPCYAEGTGDILTPSSVDLSGLWMAIVKPDCSIPTREAFAGITPHQPSEPLLDLLSLPIERWMGRIINDFEASVFPNHPELPRLKESLIRSGAIYASMSGSGSAIFGIYDNESSARKAADLCDVPFRTVLLL